ncbi:MAG: CsiV family protein [Gammaproteobacteria bacterium]
MHGKFTIATFRRRVPLVVATTIVLLSLALYAMILSPQAIGATTEYIVEIIVFENDGSSDGGELWRETEGQPPVGNAISLANNDVKITELGADQLELSGTANILRRSGRYRILTHKAWIQPGFTRKQAKNVRIRTESGWLDGTVRLESGRYLHLYLDFVYSPPVRFAGASSMRLKQRRRVRKRELHYFDHPRFSVLVMVRS